MRSPEHKRAFLAAGLKASARKRQRGAALAAGTAAINYNPYGHLGEVTVKGGLDASPAAFKPVGALIGDYEYIDDSLDDVLLRALRERVVYAGCTYHHHEPLFQDITLDVLAAVCRKHDSAVPPMPTGLLKPFRLETPLVPKTKPKRRGRPPLAEVIVAEAARTGYREGRSLSEVVDDMFKTS